MRKEFEKQLRRLVIAHLDEKVAKELDHLLNEETKRGFTYGDIATNGDIILAVVDAKRFPLLKKKEDIEVVVNSVGESNDLQDEITRIIEVHSQYHLEAPENFKIDPATDELFEGIQLPPEAFVPNGAEIERRNIERFFADPPEWSIPYDRE